MLRTTGETALSDRALAALLAELPARAPARPVQVDRDSNDELPAPGRADDFLAAEDAETRERTIADALRHLNAEDQVLLRMRFWEGLSVADISRSLGLPQKPLYRKLDRAMAQVRTRLEQAGMSREYANAVLNA